MISQTWIYIFIAFGFIILIGVAVILAIFVNSSPATIPFITLTPTPTITPTTTPTVTITPTPTPTPPKLQDFLYLSTIDSIVAYDLRPDGVPITPTTIIPLTGGLANTQYSRLALSEDYKTMWFLCSTGLVPMDLTVNPPTIPSTVAIPMSIAAEGFVAAGGRGFVIDGFDFKVVDLTTHTLLDTLPFPSGGGRSLVLSLDGSKAYVAVTTAGISVIQIVDNIQTTATFGLSSAPNAGIVAPLSIAITPDGKTLYVANSDAITGDVYPVDVSGPTPIIGTPISVTPTIAGLLGIVVAPDDTILTVGQGAGPTGLLSRIIGTTPQTNIETLGLGPSHLTIKTDITPNIAYIVNSIALEVRPFNLTSLVVGPSASTGTASIGFNSTLGPVPGTV